MCDCCLFREAGRRMGSHLEVWDLFYLGQLTTELGLCFLGCYEPFCKLGKDTPPSGRNTVPCQGVLLGRPSLVVTFIPYLPPLDKPFCAVANLQDCSLVLGTGMVGLGSFLSNYQWPTRFVIFIHHSSPFYLIHALHAQLSFLLSLLWFGITCILYPQS